MIEALKNGDHFIFEQVFNDYHEKLYFYLVNKTNSHYLAEEITQITFLKLWQYRKNLNEELSLSIQIFRIAKTSLIDEVRKRENFTRLQEEVKLNNYNDIQITNAGSEKEIKQTLERAMQTMPKVRRKVFELSRIHGFSYKEIAEQLSISVKTVENHIGNALRQLRTFFTFLINLLPLFLFF